jgi:hypothetical protein
MLINMFYKIFHVQSGTVLNLPLARQEVHPVVQQQVTSGLPNPVGGLLHG